MRILQIDVGSCETLYCVQNAVNFFLQRYPNTDIKSICIEPIHGGYTYLITYEVDANDVPS